MRHSCLLLVVAVLVFVSISLVCVTASALEEKKEHVEKNDLHQNDEKNEKPIATNSPNMVKKEPAKKSPSGFRIERTPDGGFQFRLNIDYDSTSGTENESENGKELSKTPASALEETKHSPSNSETAETDAASSSTESTDGNGDLLSAAGKEIKKFLSNAGIDVDKVGRMLENAIREGIDSVENSPSQKKEEQPLEESNVGVSDFRFSRRIRDSERPVSRSDQVSASESPKPPQAQTADSTQGASSRVIRLRKRLFEKAEDLRSASNTSHALKYLYKARELGSLDASYRLGLMHLFGEGVAQDLDLAARYMNESAHRGHTHAQFEFGFLLLYGIGMRSSETLGLLHYHMSSQGGNIAASHALAYRQLHGIGFRENCKQALGLYRGVAQQVLSEHIASGGHAKQVDAVDISSHRSIVSKTREKDMLDLYEYSAAKGDPKAHLYLGYANLMGWNGLPQNGEAALRHFEAAVERGDPAAKSALGQLFAQGIGVPQNNETALKYFREAARVGDASAQNGLGYMYLNGFGVKKDPKAAFKYFSVAAEQNNPEALFNVAFMYQNGLGTEVNYPKAVEYYTRAVTAGQYLAHFQLGVLWSEGKGVQASCPTAVSHFKKIAEKGSWSVVLEDAFSLYQEGKYEDALLEYLLAAERGYEMAQMNAAYLLDKGLGSELLCRNCTAKERRRAALQYSLILYRRAAKQGNVNANLKVGNLLYRLGQLEPELYKEAVDFYRRASDGRSAEASFQLGFMHQFGIGLPRDFHLAKRFYDLAGSSSRQAVLPALLAVISLGIHSLFSGDIVGGLGDPLSTWEGITMIGFSGLLLGLLFARVLLPPSQDHVLDAIEIISSSGSTADASSNIRPAEEVNVNGNHEPADHADRSHGLRQRQPAVPRDQSGGE